jgi:hypothetical protein
MSLRSNDLGPELRPSRALLHPLWLTSLAVLVLNDHVLKGASILPGVVTGKLSDFAGLAVAPVLLAALVRVRGSRGLRAAHVAVGLVFSAIQLSALAASLWSGAMAAVGFPWVITRDATDLVALPALLLSYHVLRAAMRRPAPTSARRSAELLAAGTGLLCCAATSPPPGEPFRSPLWTDVYVHNTSDQAVVVRMRALANTVVLDCSAVAEDPGRLISEPLFGASESFLLDPDQNFGLRLNNEWDEWDSGGIDEDGEPVERDCYAVLLDVDGLPPAVAFWTLGDVPLHDVPGVGAEESEPRGRIELKPSGDPDTLGTYEAVGDDVLYVVPAAAPPIAGACAPQSDGGRIEWSEPLPEGTWELVAITRGADGCFALDLGIRDDADQIIEQNRWYLCAPLAELSLEPGRIVGVASLGGGTSGEGGVVLYTDDAGPEPVDPTLPPMIELQAYRGTVFPQFHELQVAAVPEFDCGYVVGPECGTITRATSVTVGGGAFGALDLAPGERETVTDEAGAQLTVALAHAEERAGADPECAQGPDALGLDLEVVALYVGPTG